MPAKRKRPVGITIFSLFMLWIGGIGTVTFPLTAYQGADVVLWRMIAGGVIHSERLLTITAVVFSVLYFLADVAYLVIGFGLWRLRNWARRALLVIQIAFGGGSGLLIPFFVRSGWLAVSEVAGITIPSAWIAWYLLRPRVRFAFGAFPPGPNGEAPGGLSTRARVGVGIAFAVTTLGLFIVALLITIESSVHSSEVWALALTQAKSSPCVMERIGSPLEPGWLTTGGLETSDQDGSANLSIPVRGSKGKGGIEVFAEERNGAWTITSLMLTTKTGQINITTPGSDCR